MIKREWTSGNLLSEENRKALFDVEDSFLKLMLLKMNQNQTEVSAYALYFKFD